MQTQFEVIFPATYREGGKIHVIKALRALTFLGLKEAKDSSEAPGSTHTFRIIKSATTSEQTIEENLNILRKNGCEVSLTKLKLLQDIRNLASNALSLGEDELASDLTQLLLAYKLKGQ